MTPDQVDPRGRAALEGVRERLHGESKTENQLAMLVCPADGTILSNRSIHDRGIECPHCQQNWPIDAVLVVNRQ